MALYCLYSWLDFVLVLTIDLSGLDGIGIYGCLASYSFVLRIYLSRYVGTRVSGCRASVIAGYPGLVTLLLSFLVSWNILEVFDLD